MGTMNLKPYIEEEMNIIDTKEEKIESFGPDMEGDEILENMDNLENIEKIDCDNYEEELTKKKWTNKTKPSKYVFSC